ncbi:NTP transferase domain-containing protein [Algoriphagus namhaensis]|uniref:NTP transferase domain-containing protein n=1 Tax=Algoriphagus namhaensis TaxID=915353 RepID=A0ABV8AN82_9BACT
MPKLEILFLAAGESSRMEQSKALLDWHGEPLISYQIRKLEALGLSISVVLGGYVDQIEPILKELSIKTFFNPDWQEGMGKSLAYGVTKLLEASPEMEGILVYLVDQPLIALEDLHELIKTHAENPEKIIISRSAQGWSGPPAIFPKNFYAELSQLESDEGAKPLVKKHSDSVIFYSCHSSMEDMDTPEAYRNLLDKSSLQS